METPVRPNAMRESPVAELHVLKCELAGEVLRSFGELRLRATGRSMVPTIFSGDILVIEPTSGPCVHEGDIVLFRSHGRLFAHRVSEMSANQEDFRIITQGDALPQPDPPVSDSQLLGKVTFLVRRGRRLQPANSLSLSCRAVAAVLRRVPSAARLIAGVHKMAQGSKLFHTKQSGIQELRLCQN